MTMVVISVSINLKQSETLGGHLARCFFLVCGFFFIDPSNTMVVV